MDKEAAEHVVRGPVDANSGRAGMEVVIDRKQLRARFRQERLKRARSWTPRSGESLTPKEFLFLVEISADERDYRETVLFLRRAASPNKNRSTPDYLKVMFRDGVVFVDMVQGRPGGPISVEYRVPINRLEERYVRVAHELVDLRSRKLRGCLNDVTLHRLAQLALETHRTIPEMIWASVEALFVQPIRQEES